MRMMRLMARSVRLMTLIRLCGSELIEYCCKKITVMQCQQYFYLDAAQSPGVNKCPYCLHYWREESQIFIKFGKVFWWWCEAAPDFLPKYSFNYLWGSLMVENPKISSPIIIPQITRNPSQISSPNIPSNICGEEFLVV